MAAKTTEQLREAALELGVTLTGNETHAEIKALYDAAKLKVTPMGGENTQTDGENLAETKVEEPAGDDDADEDDLEAGSKSLKAKVDGVKAARSAGTPEGDKMYSKSDVFKIIEEYKKQQGEKKTEEDVEEINYSTVRVPRYKNKFIIGFKRQQMDEFFQTDNVFAIDIYDEKQRTMIPTVIALFDGWTADMKPEQAAEFEMTVPLHKLVQVAGKYTVACKVVEEKETDLSYSLGKVEKVQYKDDTYRPEATGVKVNQKVVKKHVEYIVEIPEENRKILVQPEVINW